MAILLTAFEAYEAAKMDYQEADRQVRESLEKQLISPGEFRIAIHYNMVQRLQKRINDGELPLILPVRSSSLQAKAAK